MNSLMKSVLLVLIDALIFIKYQDFLKIDSDTIIMACINIENKLNMYKNSKLSSVQVKKIVFSIMICCIISNTKAENATDTFFGQGLQFGSKDSNYYMKFSARLQSRFDGTFVEGNDFTKKYQFRRARFKFDGFTFSPKLVYKIEYDLVNSQMLDAVLKWNFAGNFHLWLGQTKLPGNRERVISSQKLQFVDRSLLNSKFNIDRDIGVQLRHSFNMGGMVIREALSLSKGEGRKFNGPNIGNDYTGRLELLPFGEFAGKGDYFSSDLKREATPKLAFGISYDYNEDAVKSRGQLGDVLTESRDLSTVFMDMMYKYKGVSILAEYANKNAANGTAAIFDTTGDLVESFYTGSAVNAQIGYLFKNNWEISGRYTTVTPEKVTQNNDLKQLTLGLSKYIVGHSLKVQSDLSLLQEDSKDDKLIFRLQLELAF